MKLIKFLTFLFISHFLMLSLKADKVVRVLTVDDYPPFSFRKEGRKGSREIIPPGGKSTLIKGFSWDVVLRAFHSQGYTVQLNVLPWNVAKRKLKENKGDVLFPTVKTEEREKLYYYSENFTHSTPLVVYVLPQSKWNWRGLYSLKDKRIGTVKGFSYGEEFDRIKYIRKDVGLNVFDHFKKLHSKKLDGVAGYASKVDYELSRRGVMKKYRKLPPFDYIYEFVVTIKSDQIRINKVNDFDKGMTLIQQNGEFKKLQRAWGLSSSDLLYGL